MTQKIIGIIGGGPAGLAAAREVCAQGHQAVLIDSNSQVGGQYYRHLNEDHADDDGRLHHGWKQFVQLRSAFRAAINTGLLKFYGACTAWSVQQTNNGFCIRLAPTVRSDKTRDLPDSITVEKLIVATGSFDRPLPIPGWDIPGVFAAGGIQAFIKGQGVLPGKRILLAGTGPFLLPVAANIIAAGGEVAAVCESADLRAWKKHLKTAFRVPEKAIEGAEYAAIFTKNKLKYLPRTAVVEIHGQDRVEAVTVAKVALDGTVINGSQQRFDDVDSVGLGYGFVPQMELLTGLGVKSQQAVDGNIVAVVDRNGETSVEGLYAVGEVTGIGGASLAVAEGAVAGFSATAVDRGAQPEPRRIQVSRKLIGRHRKFADAMHSAHPYPSSLLRGIADSTIICRCEEVTAGDIRQAAQELGATDARAVKSVARAGMGWCQGRMCGFATECLIAETTGKSLKHQSVKRPMAMPVTVGQLAEMKDGSVLTEKDNELRQSIENSLEL